MSTARPLDTAQTAHPSPAVGHPSPDVDCSSPEVFRRSPEVERYIPEVDRDIPEVERGIPEVERDIPEVERDIPEVERDIPEVERGIPEVERDIPEVERDIPEVECDAQPRFWPAMGVQQKILPVLSIALQQRQGCWHRAAATGPSEVSGDVVVRAHANQRAEVADDCQRLLVAGISHGRQRVVAEHVASRREWRW